jgi:hypothetical protein
MVYALKKFRHYLLGSHFKMYIDHSALKYLVNNLVLGRRICRWLLMFHKYGFEIVKPGKLNEIPDHLSHILSREYVWNLDDILSDAYLFAVKMVDDYFVDMVQFLSTGMTPSEMTIAEKKQLVVKEIDYQLIAGNLYKLGSDGILR